MMKTTRRTMMARNMVRVTTYSGLSGDGSAGAASVESFSPEMKGATSRVCMTSNVAALQESCIRRFNVCG
jgi:hypothetical protein